ncbi:MAG TPA: hypothetical protein DIT04_01715 [Dysgonomonas sp.]|nr:hypothetical protein [Dysgonomonas sp.]
MKKIILFAAMCLSISFISAQNTEDLLNKLVEKNVLTASEAEELRKSSTAGQQKALPAKVEKVRNFFNSPYFQMGGNGQIAYTYSDVNRIHHDFKAKNLFLIVNGKLNDSFRYGFILELVNPSVQEFWGEWTAAKEFNLKAGQFKSPFTLESQLVPATLETTGYSRTISNLVGYAGTDDVLRLQNGKNNFGRDAGIMASGELVPMSGHNLIQYSLGVFQGTGVTTSEVNNTKDFAGMLLFQPVMGLRIGGGAYFGQATYLMAGADAVSDHVRNRWYLSADYKSDRFNARAEWINGNDGGIKKEGVYGLGMYYLLPQKLNVLGKVDYYNRNKDVNSEVVDYTLGINYYFYTQCRVQLNYTYSDYSNKWGAENSNAVTAQLQIAF